MNEIVLDFLSNQNLIKRYYLYSKVINFKAQYVTRSEGAFYDKYLFI